MRLEQTPWKQAAAARRMTVNFEELFQAIARAVVPASDEEAATTLHAFLGSLARFDEVVVFAYRGKERPVELFSPFGADEHAVFVTLYQAGPYLLDPFYHEAVERRPGVWRMRELAPDRFFASEYRRTYYVQTGLAEEVGFFVPIEGGASIVVSLMRKERAGAFADRDFAILRAAEPAVAALVRRAWADVDQRFQRGVGRHPRATLQAATRPDDDVWSAMNLTKREAAIVELVLQGHSSESSGLKLGISTGTVKVHRRNIYRKLGISSQAQLMSKYLKRIS